MSEPDLVVIGAGLGRTGTASLQIALERLLGGKCYHMKEVLGNPKDISKWIKVAESGLSVEEWEELFSGYRATVDYPAAPFYKDILRVYPNAKELLSVRDPKSWVKSCQGTIFSGKQGFLESILMWFTPLRGFSTMTALVKKVPLGNGFDINNEEASMEAFNNWNESVKSTVPSDKLLVFEAKEGWEPLCHFLGVPIPDEPYPHVNSTDEFRQMVTKKKLAIMIPSLGLVSLVIGGISFGVYYFLKK